MTTADAMSLVAYNSTTKLLWDAGETERFYLLDIPSGILTPVSTATAKSFYTNSSSWQLPGSCYFGSTNTNSHIKALQ